VLLPDKVQDVRRAFVEGESGGADSRVPRQEHH